MAVSVSRRGEELGQSGAGEDLGVGAQVEEHEDGREDAERQQEQGEEVGACHPEGLAVLPDELDAPDALADGLVAAEANLEGEVEQIEREHGAQREGDGVAVVEDALGEELRAAVEDAGEAEGEDDGVGESGEDAGEWRGLGERLGACLDESAGAVDDGLRRGEGDALDEALPGRLAEGLLLEVLLLLPEDDGLEEVDAAGLVPFGDELAAHHGGGGDGSVLGQLDERLLFDGADLLAGLELGNVESLGRHGYVMESWEKRGSESGGRAGRTAIRTKVTQRTEQM